jgi:hypothetical protein
MRYLPLKVVRAEKANKKNSHRNVWPLDLLMSDPELGTLHAPAN